jgi:glyoxylate/hydroxypyruvate reductase A
VVRIVDSDLTMRMTEYVALHVLMCHRRQRLYDVQQRERVWHEHSQPVASEVTVGIMGLGVLGTSAAHMLQRIGFKVVGWSRTPKTLSGIETFHGPQGLEPFLHQSEILVCLLPATPATRGIIDLDVLRKLRKHGALQGAYLINVGRGSLQVDADILTALEEGALAGAVLDVFPTEPLPVESPLWGHPKVTITPHNAAQAVPQTLALSVLEQIDRIELGHLPENTIDRTTGY